jgi:hypothetical protein
VIISGQSQTTSRNGHGKGEKSGSLHGVKNVIKNPKERKPKPKLVENIQLPSGIPPFIPSMVEPD